MDKNIEVIFDKLPKHMRENIYSFNADIINRFEEIRIRTGQNSMILCDGREISVEDRELITQSILPNHHTHKNCRCQLRLRTDLLFNGNIHRKTGFPIFSLIYVPSLVSI